MTSEDNVVSAMRRALEISLRGRGRVSPNPLVGCVILKDERIIAEGWHTAFGKAHAEIEAIRAATESVVGATLVCTLEPCSHYGKNPPCADAIIEAGIRRVVVATTDPNPIVNGRGIARLLEAGIEVEVGVLQEECSWENRFFLQSIQRRRPFTILKVAQSIDGCVQTANGLSQWISSEQSRSLVHQMRSEIDAVCVGSGTVIADDPQLTVRLAEGRSPQRVVIDSRLRIPLSSRVVSDESARRTIVFTGEQQRERPDVKTLTDRGVRIEFVTTRDKGVCDLSEVCSRLYGVYDIQSLMIEPGPGLASAFLTHGLVDELHFFIAPIILGDGRSAFSSFLSVNIETAPRFKVRSSTMVGPDVHIVMSADT